ncbi:MAG: helix-turn-helix domain-containing protein [Phycisphaerales bacterium]
MNFLPSTASKAAECEVPALALRAPDAARALGISPRLLWTLTNQNVVPHVRLGKAVIYPVDQLRDWLAAQATGGPQR